MANKKNDKKYNIDEEIIIGYNTPHANTSHTKKVPPKNKEKIKGKNNVKKKKKNGTFKKVILTLLKIILIIGVIVGIALFLFVSPVFNITEIIVRNASKISENTYIVLSEIQIGENMFKVRSSRVKELIEKEPYVEEIEVIREYPGTIIIDTKERKPEYQTEKNGMYIYIDRNGYILEENSQKLELPILKGIKTDLSTTPKGERLLEDDLSKFNDLIKIVEATKNNEITVKLSSVDISNKDNYILEFEEMKKTVELGKTNDLSTKMLWIKYFIENRKDEEGIIHLNNENVYFSPVEQAKEENK